MSKALICLVVSNMYKWVCLKIRHTAPNGHFNAKHWLLTSGIFGIEISDAQHSYVLSTIETGCLVKMIHVVWVVKTTTQWCQWDLIGWIVLLFFMKTLVEPSKKVLEHDSALEHGSEFLPEGVVRYFGYVLRLRCSTLTFFDSVCLVVIPHSFLFCFSKFSCQKFISPCLRAPDFSDPGPPGFKWIQHTMLDPESQWLGEILVVNSYAKPC
jgi:hypothetical protein